MIKKSRRLQKKRSEPIRIIVTTEEGFFVRIETEKIETIEKDGKVTKTFSKPPSPMNLPEFVFSQQVGNDLVILGNSLFREKLASLLPDFRFSIISFRKPIGSGTIQQVAFLKLNSFY